MVPPLHCIPAGLEFLNLTIPPLDIFVSQHLKWEVGTDPWPSFIDLHNCYKSK